jgi:hypothetical protein
MQYKYLLSLVKYCRSLESLDVVAVCYGKGISDVANS